MRNNKKTRAILFLFASAMTLTTICRMVEGAIKLPEGELIAGAKITYFGGDAVEKLEDGKYKRCYLPDNETIVLGNERIINGEKFIRIRNLRNYGTCVPGRPIFLGTASIKFNGYMLRK